LLFVEGRITVASGGPADTYVERVREALSLLDHQKNVGRAAMLYAALSQAYGWAGLLRDALAANDVALERVSSIEQFDRQFLGYSVEHWAKSLRGRILARLGDFDGAERCFEEILEIEHSRIDPTVQFIAHMGYIDIARFRDHAHIAEQHAMRVAEIAERHGSPYLRVFAFASGGAAKSIAKDFTGAVCDFTESLEFIRRTRAAMEYEPEILASLSDCHYQAGEYERAVVTANEAVEIARQRSARLPECRASMTCGAALLAKHGTGRLNEAEALFSRAEELIRLSGARIYEAPLAQERARLATLVERSLRPH
jgi:adenylate cyclase